MSEQKIQQLLVLAVKSIKSGDKDKGRQAFLAVLKLDPNNETGWMGLVSVAKDNRERLTALKKVLTLNPNSDRALAVLDKLGIPPERLLGDTTPDEPASPPPQPEPEPDVYDAPSSFESASFTDIPSEPSAFAEERYIPPSESEPEAPPEPQRSVFELPPPMLGSEIGVPVANPQALGNIAEDVENLVNDYLASEYQFENTKWIRKTKRRAGERDIWKWRGQVFGVIASVLLLFVGLPAMIFISTPEGQKVLYAPTHTQTATFTFTPSHTPGITPTPSSVPNVTFTPTPTFQIRGIEGQLDLNVSPVPTEAYAPGDLAPGFNIIKAWNLIRAEEYNEAFVILEDEKLTELAYPYPYYLQAQIDLLGNDDPEEARNKIAEGEALLEEAAAERRTGFAPMYSLGQGDILLYEASKAQREGRTNDATRLFKEAEERFRTAINLDGEMTIAYVQLARLQVEKQEYQEAINILNIPIEGDINDEFFTDILLRVERGRVYYAQGVYDRALQEANEALFFEPWSEEAYILQADAALAMNRPGDANNYLDGYQLVYPESLLAYKLEGDAYRIEGKADQALLAYNIALQGNEDNPDYLIVLEARADLYFNQRRFSLALVSYTEYLDTRKSNRVRSKRMLAAYNDGNYAVALDDAKKLENTGVVSNGDLVLLQGQILVDTAQTTTDYNDALQQLNQAILTLGVSEEGRSIADEYLARTHFALENYEQARLSIDRALVTGETGSRHYLKGQILQEQEDYEAARNEYEFIIAWGQIFPYPFLEDSQERYDEVVDLIENPPDEET
jgi:tetratricopeptide (TPR) repeat protein